MRHHHLERYRNQEEYFVKRRRGYESENGFLGCYRFHEKMRKLKRKLFCLISRKKRNEIQHSIEANWNTNIKLAWWNDKASANEKATNLSDNVAEILNENDIGILGLSEANVYKKDGPSATRIKGYDLITDGLHKNYGRARSVLYVLRIT